MEESDAIKIKGLEIQMENNTKKLDDIDKKLDRNFEMFTRKMDKLETEKVSHLELAEKLNTAVDTRVGTLESRVSRFEKKLTITPVITFVCGAILAPLLLYLIVEYFKTH